MRTPSPILILFIAVLSACNQSQDLFNGRNLSGWHMDVPAIDENPEAPVPFLVRDGLLVSLGEPRGHLISDAEYSDYKLDVEYRFAGEPGNCGVLIHASTPRALYNMFPQSLEVQMQHGDAGDFGVLWKTSPFRIWKAAVAQKKIGVLPKARNAGLKT